MFTKRSNRIGVSSAAIGLMAASALALSACSPSEPEGDADDVTISFWHIYAGAQGEVMSELIDGFEGEYPHIKVKEEFSGTFGELNAKIVTALEANAAPNLALVNPNGVLANLESGKVLDLAPFRDDPEVGYSSEELDDFLPLQLDFTRFAGADGKQLSWPFTAANTTMFYNLDILKSVGFTKPPATWGEFEKICDAVVSELNVACYAANSDTSTLDAFGATYGATIMDDEGKPTYDSDEWNRALTMLAGWAKNGYALVAGGQAGVLTPDIAEFVSGQAAFIFNQSSNIPAVKQTIAGAFDWSAGPYPQPKETSEPVTVLYGPQLTAFQSNEDAERASWLFMKYLASPESQATWSMGSGFLPVRSSVAESAEYAKFLKAEPEIANMYESLPYAYFEGAFNEDGLVSAILSSQRGQIGDVMTAILTGTIDPAGAQDQLQAALGG